MNAVFRLISFAPSSVIERRTKMFRAVLFLFYSSVAVALRESRTDEIFVHLPGGIVRGEEIKGERQNVFYSFRGIPYAEPPLGNLRFKPPVAKRPWKNILNAVQDSPSCPQMNFFTIKYSGSEDCLYLNVYTPKHPYYNNTEKFDVVFHVHGGGFASFDGSTNFYDPGRFPLKRLVLVSITYRVGALGFLSTLDAESPGNYGLLDQVEALRWVQKNIEFFGGNAKRVTIFGQSAGGASVLYLLLSPLSKGLFHQVIATSGSPLCGWAYQRDPVYWAKRLARNIGCSNKSHEFLRCLRTKTAQEITEKSTIQVYGLLYLTYTPTLDNYFIRDTPFSIIRKRKYDTSIPVLIGTTKDEGNCWYLGRNDSKDFTDTEIFEVLRTAVVVKPNTDKLVERVRQKYLHNLDNYSNDYVQRRLAKIFTDGIYHKCILQTVKELSKSGTNIHFFWYDYEAPYSQSEIFNKSASYGVCHGDDLYPLFSGSLFHLNNDDQMSKNMRKNYRELIKKFISKRNPMPLSDERVNCEWPTVDRNRTFIYHFDTLCSVEIYDSHKDDLFSFWTKIINPAEGTKKLVINKLRKTLL